MLDVLQFSVLGLGTGAVYALLALGLVTLYRGSGVLNFAHAAIAMVSAFVFAELRGPQEWPLAPSIIVSVGAAVAIGTLTYQLLMRPLARSSSLSRVIATLGLLLTIQGAAVLIWTSQAKFVTPFLPDGLVEVGELRIGVDRLVLVGIAAAIALLLWAGYRFTTVGLATTAVSENRRAASALGWSPSLLATLNWGLASALAGIAGILIAPLTGIQIGTMTLLIIPALAAALVGGLTSFPLTLLGALGIGVAQSLTSGYVDQQGAAESVPFLLIVLFLVLRGKGLPVRGYVGERFADVGSGLIRPKVVVPLLVAATVLVLAVFPVELLDALTITFAVSCILLSIVVLTGYTGQLSLAQFALGGIGAFVAAKLVAEAGVPFPLALVIGVFATVPIGVLFGLPALRTRGVNLAIVTLGLGLAVQAMLFNNADITGGSDGTPVGAQTFFGIDIDPIAHPERYALLALALFTVCALLVANVRRGSTGRRLLAVRTNERAAAALGISVFEVKLYAFGLSALLAAVGGVLLGFKGHTVLYSPYTPLDSITGVAFAVVGSVGWVAGAVLGATLYAGAFGSWLTEAIFGGSIDSYLVLIGGVSLLVLLLQNPNGLASGNYHIGTLLLKRIRRSAAERRDATRGHLLAGATERADRKALPRTLEIRDLTVRYGGVTAVQDYSVTVAPGQIVGLIGPNGAGKTTVIDAVTGYAKTAGGTVALGGASLDDLAVHQRARAGLTRSFQSLELFEDVTVLENLRAASDPPGRRAYMTDLVGAGGGGLSAAAVSAIREFSLEDTLDKRPEEIPYGRRRLVAVARAVAADPGILLLDEPAAGLDEHETAELAEFVRALADRWGIGVLLVEHDMTFVMSVCDRITVLDFGRQIADGTVDEVRRDPAVIAAYLGEPEEESADSEEPVKAGEGKRES